MTFRIQHLQWFGSVVIAALCLVLGGVSVVANVTDYERYRQGSEQLTRFMAVLAAADAISAERGPANGLMDAADAERAHLAAALAAKRRETDRHIAAMEAAFQREIDGSPGIRGFVSAIRSSLDRGRRTVDAVAAAPRAQRSGGQITRAIEMMFAAADSAQALRDELGRAIVRLTPHVATEIILSTAASLFREQAGRLGSYVVMMLTSDAGDQDRFVARFNETGTRLLELRALLSGYSGPVLSDVAVEPLLAEVEARYFAESLRIAREVAGQRAVAGGMSAAEFTDRYVPGMRPVEELRQLIAQTSLAGMDRARDAALRLVIGSGTLTALAVLVLVGIAALFRHALFRPLIAVRRQILAISGGDLSVPVGMRRVSGEIREMFDGLNMLRDQQRQKQAIEDERQRMAEQLRRLSETDTLTGLLNRRALGEAAVRALEAADAQGQFVSAVIFDIDHFKSINDSHGHTVGDLALRSVADCLRPLLRPGDPFARYGGEEFVVLLRGADQARACLIAERLRRQLGRTPVGEDPPLIVTASFGVASRAPGAAMTADDLIAAADRGLYRAKKSGRNQVCLEGGATALAS